MGGCEREDREAEEKLWNVIVRFKSEVGSKNCSVGIYEISGETMCSEAGLMFQLSEMCAEYRGNHTHGERGEGTTSKWCIQRMLSYEKRN